MLESLISEYLFLENIHQVVIFSIIIVLAGIVRGCIGFGFSAIVVTSTSFWLPAPAVVTLVVLLEVIASLTMIRSIRKDVNTSFLWPLCGGLLLTNFLGVWLLANLPSVILQWIIGVYMITIAGSSLVGYQFRGTATQKRIFGIGLLSGFFNGLAAVGGIVVAWGLLGFKSPVRKIRATLVVFFLASETMFLIGAHINGLITTGIIFTVIYSTFPLAAGIWIGSRLFSQFSEDALKQLVLVGLITLSLLGLYKTMF